MTIFQFPADQIDRFLSWWSIRAGSWNYFDQELKLQPSPMSNTMSALVTEKSSSKIERAYSINGSQTTELKASSGHESES